MFFIFEDGCAKDILLNILRENTNDSFLKAIHFLNQFFIQSYKISDNMIENAAEMRDNIIHIGSDSSFTHKRRRLFGITLTAAQKEFMLFEINDARMNGANGGVDVRTFFISNKNIFI